MRFIFGYSLLTKLTGVTPVITYRMRI